MIFYIVQRIGQHHEKKPQPPGRFRRPWLRRCEPQLPAAGHAAGGSLGGGGRGAR